MQNLTLHHRNSGGPLISFGYRKQLYDIPAIVILRAMTECSDRQVFDAIVQSDLSNTFLTERVDLMLR